MGKRCRKVWTHTLTCFMWLVWLEQNNHTFEEVDESVTRLKSRFLGYSWLFFDVSPEMLAFLDFVDSLSDSECF